MKTYSKEELAEILGKHKKYLNNDKGGQRADLNYADLSSADLRYAVLNYADLSYADLRYADLRSAVLRSADLSYADLSSADLRYAVLSYADLSSADLRYADLRYADLRYAVLRSADLSYADLSSADLRYAVLSGNSAFKRGLVNFSGGSENRTSVYDAKYDKVHCGCFKGTLEEFSDRVRSVYPDEANQFRQQYEIGILLFSLHRQRMVANGETEDEKAPIEKPETVQTEPEPGASTRP